MRKRAQGLRKNATEEERILWYQYLRNYPVQWNRQKVIGGYIVDFCCSSARLVIEIDGAQRYDEATMEYDRKRTEYLNQLGYEVLRYTNTDVTRNLRVVCEAVDNAVKQRKSQVKERL